MAVHTVLKAGARSLVAILLPDRLALHGSITSQVLCKRVHNAMWDWESKRRERMNLEVQERWGSVPTKGSLAPFLSSFISGHWVHFFESFISEQNDQLLHSWLMNLPKVVESLSYTPDLGFNHEQTLRTTTTCDNHGKWRWPWVM
jgi:hypothetical protein